MSGGEKSIEKACFIKLNEKDETTNDKFYVQFNPKEFKVEESAQFEDEKTPSSDKPLVQFKQIQAATCDMELIFDTTDDGTDVSEWIDPLRSFLYAPLTKKDANQPGSSVSRPPKVMFMWKSFEMKAVITKLSITYLLFKPDGTPLRAKVSVGLKEAFDRKAAFATNNVKLKLPDRIVKDAKEAAKAAEAKTSETKTAQPRPKETLSQIAARVGNGATERQIAIANNLDNPFYLDIAFGLIIPGDDVTASVFEALHKSDAPAAWSDYTPQLNEDSDLADIWPNEPSTFQHSEEELTEWNFEVYMANPPEATEFSGHVYAEENVAEFSAAYTSSKEATTMEFGESELADGFSNEATTYEAKGPAAENVAIFSATFTSSKEATTMEFGESELADGFSNEPTTFEAKGPAKENVAEFSDKKKGDNEAGTFKHGDSDKSDTLGSGGPGGGGKPGGGGDSGSGSTTSGGGGSSSSGPSGAGDNASSSGGGPAGGSSGGGKGPDKAPPPTSKEKGESRAGGPMTRDSGGSSGGSSGGASGAASSNASTDGGSSAKKPNMADTLKDVKDSANKVEDVAKKAT